MIVMLLAGAFSAGIGVSILQLSEMVRSPRWLMFLARCIAILLFIASLLCILTVAMFSE